MTAKTQTSTWSKTENLANKLKSSSRAKEIQQQRKEEPSVPVSDGFQNISKKANLQEDLWNTNSSSSDNGIYLLMLCSYLSIVQLFYFIL